jgi:hypothetical protein
MTLEEKIAQTESLWITNNLKSFIDEKGNSPDAKVRRFSRTASDSSVA